MKTLFSIVLLTIGSAGPLYAAEANQDVATQLNSANALLRDGDVEGAMAAYQQLEQLGPPSAALIYNHAVAQYRHGDVAAAAEQFKSVAASDDDAIAAKARFNLGNCDYVSALQLVEQDRPAAIDRLRSAIEHYRSALDVDTADAEARANIELAAQMIDRLQEEERQEQEQQQEQQQQQDRQQQDQQDQQGEQQDQQQDSSQQSQDQNQSSAEQQNSEQQNSDSSEQSQQEDQQSDNQEAENQEAQDQQASDGQSQSEQQQPEDQQAQEQQAGEDASESEEQQQQNAETQNQPQASTQSMSQEQASQQESQEIGEEQNSGAESDEISEEQANEPPKGELSAVEQSDEQDADEQQAAGKVLKEGEMTEEEADKMLQSIRDRDMLRRLRREATERSRHIPVDRDW
ncbi:hypothetical protein NG895_27975 [Aeoliella sp. ICT_H6.2]|uniref:Tetratricopeptide repeat protein n=1 Tax=Aeoliella straminimaris TaxID=2954799 RepID=A0A9X2FEW5_9BACT|nr:hypothetical protein [Aeoliella straminimaris]MCO6047760.1 hypothetical protein [Aeoliella straminimaris]